MLMSIEFFFVLLLSLPKLYMYMLLIANTFTMPFDQVHSAHTCVNKNQSGTGFALDNFIVCNLSLHSCVGWGPKIGCIKYAIL